MKNIKINLLLLVMLFAFSCAQEDGPLYQNPDGKVTVSLASDKYVADLVPADGNQITLNVYRSTTEGALNVPFTFTSASELFTMADPVAHFANGESVASLVISFPGAAAMAVATTYSPKVTLSDKTILSDGGISELTLRLTRKLTWKNIGVGSIISNDAWEDDEAYDLEYERVEEAPNLYKALDVYKDGYHLLIEVNFSAGTAKIAQQEIGVSLFGASYPRTWLRADACTYSNGVITVVPGSANVFNRWIVEPAPSTLGAWVGAPEIFTLPAGSY